MVSWSTRLRSALLLGSESLQDVGWMPELSRTHRHDALNVLQVPSVMAQILAVLFLKDSWLACSSGAPLNRSTAGAGVCPAAGQHLIQNNSERPTHNCTVLEHFITTRNYNHQNAFRTAHSKTPSQGQLGLPELRTRDHQLPPSLLHHRSSSSNVSVHLSIIISSSMGRSGSCKTQVEEDSSFI